MSSFLKKPDVCKIDGKIMEYVHTGIDFKVTCEMKHVFDWDGCLIVRGLLNKDEVARITKCLEGNPEYLNKAWEQADGKGKASRLLVWNHPGTDITGMVGRCQKIVDTAETLLGDEVYHYHSKLIMKEAHTGGAHLWHQDYGYWYHNGCLKPDMMTAFIALDRSVKENGCLEVIKGSHRCGRIEHAMQYGQTVADQTRIDDLCKHFDHVHAEMEPGDCLFFHCNVLHKSNQNPSAMRRWALLLAYNSADNDPIIKHHHPNYTPLHKVPNSAIMECTNFTDMTNKDYMKPTDKTLENQLVAKVIEHNYH